MISVIIPIYNEEKSIPFCLISLSHQKYVQFEIIIIDDGSTDHSIDQINKIILKNPLIPIYLYNQDHHGPASARNNGSRYAKGEILVFVDADMEFDSDFLYKLTKPIRDGKVTGTFAKEEYLSNKENTWALCWNINRYVVNRWKLDSQMYERILPKEYPSEQSVFRAIRRDAFNEVNGFDETGYADDWTISNKLGVYAKESKGAICYHNNPDSIISVFSQARWFGGNEFLNKNVFRKILNLFRYCLITSLVIGIIVGIKIKKFTFLPFKIVYDFGVFSSILTSFIYPVTKK